MTPLIRMVSVPVEDLAGKLKAIRDKFLIPTPDKDYTDYAIMTRCIDALATREEAPACKKCGDKGYTEYEGGGGEGYPSRPEIEACSCREEAPAEAREGGMLWLDVRDVPQDGTPILLNHRTHGIIQGWFSKGEWSGDTPISPREYSGDMWILGDDLYQDDVEFGEGGVVLPSGVLGWLPLSALRAQPQARSGEGQ